MSKEKTTARISYRELEKKYIQDCVLVNNIGTDERIWNNILEDEENHMQLYSWYCSNCDIFTKGEDCPKCSEPVESMYNDIFQYYIIDDYSAEFLDRHCKNEIVLYSEILDCYVWCITFFGVSWDDQFTEIEGI